MAGADSLSDGTVALRQRVWAAVAEQYPVASRGGSFAGKPVSPALTTSRFVRLVEVLGISREDAAHLVEIDATPLLVEPDGVASAFELLSEASSRMKALELVRCHPGLLVGGERSLKEGSGLVTATLVDLLFAGRLLRVLEDGSRDNTWKLAEIEHYARVAALFKPVMDVVQRRGKDLNWLSKFGMPWLVPVVVFASVHTLHQWGLTVNPGYADFMAWGIGLVAWLAWFMSEAMDTGRWGLSLGSGFLGLGSQLLSLGSWLLGVFPDQGIECWMLTLGSWLFSVSSWIMGISSSSTPVLH